MPTLWPSRLSRSQKALCCLRFWRLRAPAQLQLGQVTLMPLREACGVVGISTTTPVLHNLLVGLRALQHRGQESAGVALWDDGHLTRRGMGLVSEALTNFETHFYDAKTGIGHVRYSTAGSSSLRNAQPITASFFRELELQASPCPPSPTVKSRSTSWRRR